jgi:uncharacterized membrane protein
MSKPPAYVVNEPVATGWVRTELYGDRDRAIALVQHARAQLGWVRTIYGVNQRMAEGEAGGFYAHTQVLDDGSVIQTITNNGFDIIRIEAPPPVGKPKRRRYSDLQVSDFAVCGTCFNPEGIRQAVLWTSESAFTNIGVEVPRDDSTPPAMEFIPLEMLENGFRAEAFDISHDGTTVVGSCDMWDGSIRAFRWTLPVDDPLDPRYPGGMKDLGALKPGDFVQTKATSVSADGSIVVGFGYGTTAPTVGWIWTEAFGMQELQSPHPELGVRPWPLCISPDGSYIVGVAATPTVDNTNQQGVMWEVEYDAELGPNIKPPVLINQPGTFSQDGDVDPRMRTVADSVIPTDVTDAGLVYGHTTHQELTAWHGTGSNGGIPFEGTSYSVNPDRRRTIFTYDAPAGVFTIIGDGDGGGYADDTDITVGNSTRATLTPTSYDEDLYDPFTGEFIGHHTITTYGYADFITNGWAITPSRDQFGNITGYVQTSLGDRTVALDITSDGGGICGATVDTDGFETPVIWLEGLGRVDLPLGDGWEGGRATAIGFAKHLQAESADE